MVTCLRFGQFTLPQYVSKVQVELLSEVMVWGVVGGGGRFIGGAGCCGGGAIKSY